MSADRGVTYRNKKWLIDGSYGCHLYTFAFLLLAWTLGANKPVCNEVVDESISQSCFGAEYSESESVKEPQTEQNSMLVSRQDKRKGMWFGYGYFRSILATRLTILQDYLKTWDCMGLVAHFMEATEDRLSLLQISLLICRRVLSNIHITAPPRWVPIAVLRTATRNGW